MALRGNLRDFSLPDVFQLVTLSGKSGVLRIRRADAEGSVWFRDGEVFFAQSDWHREALGTRLVAAGKITPSALTKALDLQRGEPTGGRRLGQILVDEGYLTEKVLEAFVQEQIQDTIFDLFRWDEGDFDFESAEAAPEEDIGLSVSIENIVMEGSRRLEEWTRIKKKIPSMGIVFKMATAPGEGTFDISLKPVEWHLLLKIDGTRTVAELARELGRTDFEVARIIYGLFSAGLLEVAADDEVERLRAERTEMEAVISAEDARRARTAAPAPSAPAAGAADSAEHVVEEPAFLSAEPATPSADDMAVFEQMMGAVLEAPAAGVPATPAVAIEPEVAVVEAEPEVAEIAIEPEVAVVEAEPEVAEIAIEPEVAVVEAEPEVAEIAIEPEVAEIAIEPEVAVVEAEPEVAAEGLLPAWVVEEAEEPQGETLPSAAAEPDSMGREAHGIEDALRALGADPVLATVTEPAQEMPVVADVLGDEPPVRTPSIEAELDGVEVPLEDLSGLLDALQTEYPGDGGVAVEPPSEEVAAGRPDELDGAGPAESLVSGDYAADLMALGLGELPHELTEEIAGEGEVPDEEAETVVTDVAALSELLSGLGGEDAGDEEPVQSSAPVLDSAPELEPLAEETPSGVISTDAFLADFDNSNVTFSAGMGDEIAALTGGGPARARPTASARKVDATADAPLLRRDSHVDRELLMRIIDGVKKL
jgi:hypothetical protein